MEENRDYEAEVAELIEFAPELEGGTLPDSVIEAAAEGKSLKDAYSAFRETQAEIHKQNESARLRAPVGGVSGSGGIVSREVDDFLRGLCEEY